MEFNSTELLDAICLVYAEKTGFPVPDNLKREAVLIIHAKVGNLAIKSEYKRLSKLLNCDQKIDSMPKVKPRRLGSQGDFEDLDDWQKNNKVAIDWFLENAENIRSFLESKDTKDE